MNYLPFVCYARDYTESSDEFDCSRNCDRMFLFVISLLKLSCTSFFQLFSISFDYFVIHHVENHQIGVYVVAVAPFS